MTYFYIEYMIQESMQECGYNMKQIDIKKIMGNEVLAKDVCMNNGTIIMPSGTIVYKEYVPRLVELGVSSLFIQEEDSEYEKVNDNTIEQKIQLQCRTTVRTTLEKYSYCGNVELSEIAKVADDIMKDILTEPEVIYNVSLVREKSDSTYSHSINVSALSVLIALKMKLPKHRVRDIAVGALLHDIGIVFLPLGGYSNKYQEWTEKQKKDFKKHVIIGYSMIEKETWLSPAAKEIVLSHHEKIDGSGYPMRLKSERMKIGTKIVSVCDEFDSAVYGNFAEKLKVHTVIDYIVSQAGIKFDFDVVESFIASVAAYPLGTKVLTSTGEIGIVIRQNIKVPTRPVIRMIADKDGKAYTQNVERDLTEELTLFISDTIDEA